MRNQKSKRETDKGHEEKPKRSAKKKRQQKGTSRARWRSSSNWLETVEAGARPPPTPASSPKPDLKGRDDNEGRRSKNERRDKREGHPRVQVHANGRVHNNFCEVNHGSFGHGDEVALAVVVHSFDEALQLKICVRLRQETEIAREREEKQREIGDVRERSSAPERDEDIPWTCWRKFRRN
jgi:hypothetical protein